MAGMHGGVGTNTLTTAFLTKNKVPFANRKLFLRGLEKVREQRVEIFLGNHVGNNDTETKLKRVLNGDEMAFYAPNEWVAFLKNTAERLKKIESEEIVMQNTVDVILKEKVVVIVRGVLGKDLLAFAKAAYNGGIRLIECTYDATGAVTDEEIAQNIEMLVEHFGDEMTIGAGTVLTEKQVELTKKAGGKFIISPDTNTAIIAKTKKENLVSIPGALTPSEAITAHNAGADFVKLFPIETMGAEHLKNISAPLSHIRFLAVGGVSLENMSEYFKAGAVGIGIGSSIANKTLIASGDFDKIEQSAKAYVDGAKK